MRSRSFIALSIAVLLSGCADDADEPSGSGAGDTGGSGPGSSGASGQGGDGMGGGAPSSYGLSVEWEVELGTVSPYLAQVVDQGKDWATGPSGDLVFLRKQDPDTGVSALHLFRIGPDGSLVPGWSPLVIPMPYLTSEPVVATIASDGSVLVSASANQAWRTTKIGASGQTVYEKQLFTGEGAIPKAIAIDSAGGVIVVGKAGADIDQGMGNDCMVHRYDASGESDEAFTKLFDATSNDSGCSSLAVAPDGTVFIGGADGPAVTSWIGGLSASGAELGAVSLPGDYFLLLSPGLSSGALAMHRSQQGAHLSVLDAVALGPSIVAVDDKTVLRVASAQGAPLLASVRFPVEDLSSPVRIDWFAPSGDGYEPAGGGEIAGPPRVLDGANVSVLPAPAGGITLRRWVSEDGPLKVLVSRVVPAPL